MKKEKKSSDEVYNKILKKIIALEYRSGDHLTEHELSRSFNTSRTPVREALIRLESEGIVNIISNRGAFVSKTDFKKLIEIYKIRLHLMELVAELTIKHITEDDIDRLREILSKLKNETDHIKIEKLDSEFHLIMISAINNEELVNILTNLRIKSFTLWEYSLDSQYFLQIKDELEEIVEALIARDHKRCEQLLKKHVSGIINQVKKDL